MNRRTKGRSQMNESTKELKEHYEAFEEDFIVFFNDLKAFSEAKLLDIESQYNDK